MTTWTPMPGSQSSLREANSRRILDAVRHYGGITQVELSEATGLSPATVSTIVKQLLGAGVVDTKTTTRSGRRAQLVTLARTTGLAAGVHVANRSLRVLVGDASATVMSETLLPLPSDHRADTTLDRAALIVVDLIEQLGADLDELLAVGVALAAPVSPKTGQISARGLLPAWEDIDVAEVLARRLACQVVVDNDANLGALAESRFGAAKGCSDVVFVRASYATGAGVVLGGKPFRGRRGIAGEIGHVEVNAGGAICQCGSRGCLNTVVGADALIDSLRVSRGALTLRDLIDLASSGDPGCRQVISDAGAAIGTAVSGLALAVDPERIVVGGELAETGETLLAGMRDAIGKRVMLGGPDGAEVVLASLGQKAEATGALALAIDAVPASGVMTQEAQ